MTIVADITKGPVQELSWLAFPPPLRVDVLITTLVLHGIDETKIVRAPYKRGNAQSLSRSVARWAGVRPWPGSLAWPFQTNRTNQGLLGR